MKLKEMRIKTVLTVLSIAILAQPLRAQISAENPIVIHQEVKFGAAPVRVYGVLMGTKEFSGSVKNSFPNFSATSCTIDPSAGGTFSLFDGHIIGRTLELIPNQRIVQAWRVVDWPAGVYSIARFELKSDGAGTLLVFDHIGFPAGLKDHLADGWKQHYWDAIKKYLD